MSLNFKYGKVSAITAGCFDILCKEESSQTYAMMAFSKTGCSTVSYVLIRILRMKSVPQFVPNFVEQDGDEQNIDPTFQPPGVHVDITNVIEF